MIFGISTFDYLLSTEFQLKSEEAVGGLPSLEEFCSRLLKFFMQPSLAEIFMQAKFQVKIRKYSFATDVDIL